MEHFQLDPQLGEALRGIRQDVRRLFEQLRLDHVDGDRSGRERLERVPALAKRNFANLRGANAHLAAKEAWRLIDFLEGNAKGQLSALAREALRPVELDRKLAAWRASLEWRDAAARLREALGVEPRADETPPTPAPADLNAETGGASAAADPGREDSAETVGNGVVVRRRRRHALAIGSLLTLSALGAAAAAWWHKGGADPRIACLALEDASPAALAAHRSVSLGKQLARPRPGTPPREEIFPIEDPADGGPVRSTWITSQYSYAERNSPSHPGGGKSDFRLRVGGHGDTYVSLLQVPVPTDRLVHQAVIELTVIGDVADSRPTSMVLRAIGDHWQVAPGPDNRIWWRDCPRSEAIATGLPPPGPRGTVYRIDITDLYNMWAAGLRSPYGIMLEPEHIGSWRPGRPDYANYSTFYSSRARDRANRPRLILRY